MTAEMLHVTASVMTANDLWLNALRLLKEWPDAKKSVSGGIVDLPTCMKLTGDEFDGRQARYRSDCQATP